MNPLVIEFCMNLEGSLFSKDFFTGNCWYHLEVHHVSVEERWHGFAAEVLNELKNGRNWLVTVYLYLSAFLTRIRRG